MGRGQSTQQSHLQAQRRSASFMLNNVAISKQLKSKFRQAVLKQPERFADGNNYAGRVYIMSERNHRQRKRVLDFLDGKKEKLSKADLDFLYTAIAYAYRESNTHVSSGYFQETHFSLPETPYWKKVNAIFRELGVATNANAINYEKAWEN